MLDFVKRLFASDDFMPRGHCYLWQPDIVWLSFIPDAVLALSYAVISLTLIHFIRKRRGRRPTGMLLCLGVFVVASAAMHCLEIWTLWSAIYRLAALVKAIAAAASVAAAVFLLRALPKSADQ